MKTTSKGSKAESGSKAFREAQERLTLENIYTFIIGDLVRAKVLSGENIARSDREISDLASSVVDNFIKDFNKTHPDSQLVLSERDKQQIVNNLQKPIKNLDRMVSDEFTSYAREKGTSVAEMLADPDPVLKRINEKLKLENLKKAEDSQKEKSVLTAQKMGTVRKFFYGLVESFKKYMKPPIVESLNKAISDMTNKKAIEKGGSDEKSRVGKSTDKLLKQRERTSSSEEIYRT